MCEYHCVDCGVHVFDFGRREPPNPPRCSVCLYLAEFVRDPAEQHELRQYLNRER